MAGPDVPQSIRGIGCQCLTALVIGQMTAWSGDALFEMFRIMTILQHLRVMVGLYHKIVGAGDDGCNLVCDMSAVSDDAEHNVAQLDAVSHAVGAVVRHAEGCYPEVAQLKCLAFLYAVLKFERHLAPHAIVSADALIHFLGGINGNIVFCSKRAYGANMVGMVVRNENVVHFLCL